MIRLQLSPPNSVHDAQEMLQTAVGVEFGTLPPYLYTLYSMHPNKNPQAERRIKAVAFQEMVHLCLACNVLNALGGTPVIRPMTYPNPLPGDIGPDGEALILHLYPFSQTAIEQAMNIEQPEDPPKFPEKALSAERAGPTAVSVGQFYDALDSFLKTLPPNTWQVSRNQLSDNQFFQGQLFPVNDYEDAHKAIHNIVSEGEGSRQGTKYDPLDFQGEFAHFFLFGEIFHDKLLTKVSEPPGYRWGPARLGVDWTATYPAITDPGGHDFCKESALAQAVQNSCNSAFSAMVDDLQQAVTGNVSALGQAARAMFDLRMAAKHAFTIPLADGSHVAGPAFLYRPQGERNERT
jgi:hypothetical protein